MRAAVEPKGATDSSGALLLAVLVAVLVVVGLVMVLSASSVQALRLYGSSWLFFNRQLVWVAAGTVALVLTARLDYHVWRRLAFPVLVVSFALLVLVLVPGLGIAARGSARWLGHGQFRIQPSELAKLGMVLFSAELLARRANQIDEPSRTLRPVLLVLGAVGLLVMLQPDMGTTMILVSIAFAILFVAGAPLRPMATLGAGMAFAALVLGLHAGYRRARLVTFLHPWRDAGNAGYQIVQSLVGLGTGNLTGVGLGASRAKWGFLPNAHTDFIFAIIGEELGLVGSLLVVLLFIALALLGVRSALRAPDRFGSLLGVGITTWVVGQAFVNIGAVIGILPVTGVPLPLVSFGGSSLVVTMAALGILLSVARQARPARPLRPA